MEVSNELKPHRRWSTGALWKGSPLESMLSESESEGEGDVYLQRANSAVNCTNPTEQLKPQQSEPSTEQPSSSSSACFVVLLVAVCPSVPSATAAVVSYAHGPN